MNPQKQHTLPEGWEMKKLGEVCSKILDGTHFSPQSKEGQFLYVTSKNIRNDGLDLTDVEYISEAEHKEIYKRCPVKYGDVLLTKDGAGTGASCMNTLDKEFSLLSSVAVLRGATDKLLNDFLLNLIKSPYGQIEIQNAISGQAITRITLEKIRNFKFIFPPLPEQRRIAAVLGTWDTAIEQTTELLKALRARHRGLMYQLLTGKVRLPGFGGEWRHVALSDLFERVSRRNTEGNTSVLTISAQQGLVGQGRYFNKNVASENLANYFLLYRGEFAYNKSYSAGYPMGAIKRLDQYDSGVLSPLYICFRMRSEAENEAKFFTHFFEAGCLNEGIGEIAQEGARNHGLLNVGINDFFSLRIVVPSLAEQRAIAQVLDASLKEIQQQEAKLEVLREQKRGLMQCLLTGRVRVPAA